MSKQQNIKVLCRIRPENAKEKESGCNTCIEVTSSTTLRILSNNDPILKSLPTPITSNNNNNNNNNLNDSIFTFDHIFPSNSNQLDLFTTAALPILKEAFDGVNGTLFCYGQTSSGKTFTMEGIHNNDSLKGILPRTMEYIFTTIPQLSNELEFSVKCSYYQIYNEKIQDLLDTRKSDLAIREDKTKGIWVEDCTEIYVASKDEMYEVFQCGTNNRTVAATEMNKGSSRSHSLFVVTIFKRHVITDSTKTGKIFFVDLAGSEKMSKTGITGGTGLKEAQNINKSLMTLGMVINALTENAQHVPYRDSKLTRVLQESIGGNSLTTLIITCSGNALNQSESLSTLRFGQRAKMIKNKVVANTIKSVKELLLKIAELEAKLKKYENGITNNSVLMIGNNNGNGKLIKEGNNDTRCSTEGNPMIGMGIGGGKIECEQCNKYSYQVMKLTVEMLTLQEEADQNKRDKEELEEELKEKYQEIYELNERNYICEEKDRLIIDDEVKTFEEIQIKLNTFLLFTQKKMVILKDIKDEIGIGIGGNINSYSFNNNNTTTTIANLKKKNKAHTHTEKEMITKISLSVQQLEDLINLDSKNYSEMIELLTGEEYKDIQCLNDDNNNNNNNLLTDPISISNDNIISNQIITTLSDNQNIQSHLMTITSNNSEENNNTEPNNHPNPNPNSYRKSPSITDSPIRPKQSHLKEQNLIQNQKDFISELLNTNNQLKQANEQITLEKYRNEILISKLNDSLAKVAKQLIEKDEAISELNEKIHINNEKFDVFKQSLLEDFSKKEMKMMEMINKISDLEDENYKLIHYNKDTNKKKYCIMEKQVKQLTIDMQKYINENSNLKGIVSKKEMEMRDLAIKIKDLEKKVIQNFKTIGHGHRDNNRKNNSNKSLSHYNTKEGIKSKGNGNVNGGGGVINDDISSYLNNNNNANSSFCTPMTGNNKNFKVITLNDLLKQQLMSGSGAGKDITIDHISNCNISGLTGIRKPSFNNINADNSPIISNTNTNMINRKIMKIIRGGRKGSNDDGFFHKMLVNNIHDTTEATLSKDLAMIQRKATEKINNPQENELDNMYDDDTSSFF